MPVTSFSNDRVWVTETGYVLFNDQFMLIPRQFSDYLYDLDTKASRMSDHLEVDQILRLLSCTGRWIVTCIASADRTWKLGSVIAPR